MKGRYKVLYVPTACWGRTRSGGGEDMGTKKASKVPEITPASVASLNNKEASDPQNQ